MAHIQGRRKRKAGIKRRTQQQRRLSSRVSGRHEAGKRRGGRHRKNGGAQCVRQDWTIKSEGAGPYLEGMRLAQEAVSVRQCELDGSDMGGKEVTPQRKRTGVCGGRSWG